MSEQIYSGSTLEQGVRLSGNLPGDYVARQVMPNVLTVKPWMFPLSQITFLQPNKSQQVTSSNYKFEYIDGELLWSRVQLTAAVTGGATPTVTVGTTNIKLFKAGTMVRFEETNETALVSSVNTGAGTFVCARRSASNLSSVTNSTYLQIVGSAYGENADPPTSISNYDTFRYNYPQIFQTTIKMTDRLIAATKAGGTYGGNMWKEQMQRRTEEHRRDIELGFWFNEGPYSTTSSGEVTTTTAGVFYQLLNNGGADLRYSGALDEVELDGALKQLKYGSPRKTLIGGNDIIYDIEKILKDRFQLVDKVKKYGVIGGDDFIEIMSYRSANKEIEIINNPLFEGPYTRWAAILDMEYVKTLHMAPDDKGARKMRVEMGIQTNGAPRKEAQLLSDVGIIIPAAATCAVLRPE